MYETNPRVECFWIQTKLKLKSSLNIGTTMTDVSCPQGKDNRINKTMSSLCCWHQLEHTRPILKNNLDS